MAFEQPDPGARLEGTESAAPDRPGFGVIRLDRASRGLARHRPADEVAGRYQAPAGGAARYALVKR